MAREVHIPVKGSGNSVAAARESFWQVLFVRYGVYLSLALLCLFAALVRPEIFRGNSLFLILRQASQLGLVTIGQSLVMLVGGLDLSVTGVIVLTSVIMAEVGAGQNSMILPSVFIALAIGALIGLLNGWLVVKRSVPPFVATLGMLVLVRGAQVAYTRGIPSGQIPDGVGLLSAPLGPVPISFLLWLVLTAALAFLLQATPVGRWVYAVGSNREAARLSGVPVNRVLFLAFTACSLFAVLAGIVLSGYVGYVDRYLGRGFDLDSITAAVVGGIAFTGGRGNLVSAMVGVLLIQFLSSLMLLMGLNIQMQLVVKGFVVILAVALYSGFSKEK